MFEYFVISASKDLTRDRGPPEAILTSRSERQKAPVIKVPYNTTAPPDSHLHDDFLLLPSMGLALPPASLLAPPTAVTRRLGGRPAFQEEWEGIEEEPMKRRGVSVRG